jgi:hypothetical protein
MSPEPPPGGRGKELPANSKHRQPGELTLPCVDQVSARYLAKSKMCCPLVRTLERASSGR